MTLLQSSIKKFTIQHKNICVKLIVLEIRVLKKQTLQFCNISVGVLINNSQYKTKVSISHTYCFVSASRCIPHIAEQVGRKLGNLVLRHFVHIKTLQSLTFRCSLKTLRVEWRNSTPHYWGEEMKIYFIFLEWELNSQLPHLQLHTCAPAHLC